MELDVRNATSSPDVSNSGEDAKSTETSIQIVMQSFKSAEASASSDEGCDGERED